MVSLKDACAKILDAYPGQCIGLVNEYETAYYFVLLNKGETMDNVSFVYWTPSVIKKTGEVVKDSCVLDKTWQGDYKQYTKVEIERLL